MKRFHKSVLVQRLLECIILSIPFVLCIVWLCCSLRAQCGRINSYFAVSSYSELVASYGEDIYKESQVTNNDAVFTLVYVHHSSSWTLPVFSGCTVMVFDESGVLVDKTADNGNDLNFRKKWYRRKEREMEELEK